MCQFRNTAWCYFSLIKFRSYILVSGDKPLNILLSKYNFKININFLIKENNHIFL